MSLFLFLLKELLAPAFCVGCGRYGSLLCKNCYQQINFMSVCPELENLNQSLDQLLVMGWYQGVLKQMILALKYQGVKDLAVVLANLSWYATNLPAVDLVSYVPCSAKRLQERGFNQTQEIAQGLAERLGVKCLGLVVKAKDTARQATLKTSQERALNLEGSFVLDPDLDPATFKNQSILIVDDVVTTGATLAEVARVIRKLHPSKVMALAMAHGS